MSRDTIHGSKSYVVEHVAANLQWKPVIRHNYKPEILLINSVCEMYSPRPLEPFLPKFGIMSTRPYGLAAKALFII